MADKIRIFDEGVDLGLVSTIQFIGGSVEAVSMDAYGRKVVRVTLSNILESRTSDPSAPETGRMWLRTDL